MFKHDENTLNETYKLIGCYLNSFIMTQLASQYQCNGVDNFMGHSFAGVPVQYCLLEEFEIFKNYSLDIALNI